jgi:heat shock protein HslJ
MNSKNIEKTRPTKALKTLPLFLLPLVLLVPLANATTPTVGTGSFTATVTIISISQVDGNTIINAIETQTLSGFLTGTRIANGVEIIHPDGTFNAHDSGTITGTVNGLSGTATITGSSTGIGASGSGQFVVELGTAGLSGFHAQGTFQPTVTGPTTVTGTYSLQYQFDA